jgi:hypothetical protein
MNTDQILARLNAYEQTHQDHSDPHNIWDDVIYHLHDYDDARTRILDPGGVSDRFIFEDGRYFRYEQGEWTADEITETEWADEYETPEASSARNRYWEASARERTLRTAADQAAIEREQALLDWYDSGQSYGTLATATGLSRSRIQIIIERARNR